MLNLVVGRVTIDDTCALRVELLKGFDEVRIDRLNSSFSSTVF